MCKYKHRCILTARDKWACHCWIFSLIKILFKYTQKRNTYFVGEDSTLPVKTNVGHVGCCWIILCRWDNTWMKGRQISSPQNESTQGNWEAHKIIYNSATQRGVTCLDEKQDIVQDKNKVCETSKEAVRLIKVKKNHLIRQKKPSTPILQGFELQVGSQNFVLSTAQIRNFLIWSFCILIQLPSCMAGFGRCSSSALNTCPMC